jgi:hypothetical protein
MTSNYIKMKRAFSRAYKASQAECEKYPDMDGKDITAYGVKIYWGFYSGNIFINGKRVDYTNMYAEFLYALPYKMVHLADNTWVRVIYEDDDFYHVCQVGDERLSEEFHWNIAKEDAEIQMSDVRKRLAVDEAINAILGVQPNVTQKA